MLLHFESLAKVKGWDKKVLARSCLMIKNNNRPRTLPWGTPLHKKATLERTKITRTR